MMSNRAYSAVTIRNEHILNESFSKIESTIEIKKEDMKLILNAGSKSRKQSTNYDKNFEAVKERLNMTSIPYALYVYRKEIQRRRLHISRLSQAKIELTNDLIFKSAGEIHDGLDSGVNSQNLKSEMNAFTRALMYKNKLQLRMKLTEICLKKKKVKLCKAAKELLKAGNSKVGDVGQNGEQDQETIEL